jgi:hypothetical protein
MEQRIPTVWMLAMLAGLPLAWLGLVMPANSHLDATGRYGIDCDGPLQVMLFALPALALYGTALIFFLRRLRSHRRPMHVAAAMVAAILCVGLTLNAGSAVAEHHRTDTTETCGQGW